MRGWEVGELGLCGVGRKTRGKLDANPFALLCCTCVKDRSRYNYFHILVVRPVYFLQKQRRFYNQTSPSPFFRPENLDLPPPEVSLLPSSPRWRQSGYIGNRPTDRPTGGGSIAGGKGGGGDRREWGLNGQLGGGEERGGPRSH